jgi:hypothetical protein
MTREKQLNDLDLIPSKDRRITPDAYCRGGHNQPPNLINSRDAGGGHVWGKDHPSAISRVESGERDARI